MRSEKWMVPNWVYYNLRKYNNCLINKEIIKSLGENEVAAQIESKGFKGVVIKKINGSHIIEVIGIDKSTCIF
ncbi:hypothetical protein [Anaerorhabdus sp.]|uniref:hypothetical protein n=1 Tax=Anaerorhabdus sp. TaxID=1872524 RepID=UPI002B2185F7|nr:hypothetical protein [Anaerorhabdus sp.]MEA4874508.1 hypothetical protein [Anaerorhabdus sp.]